MHCLLYFQMNWEIENIAELSHFFSSVCWIYLRLSETTLFYGRIFLRTLLACTILPINKTVNLTCVHFLFKMTKLTTQVVRMEGLEIDFIIYNPCRLPSLLSATFDPRSNEKQVLTCLPEGDY